MSSRNLTAKKKALFIEQLAQTGNITKSAEAVGIKRQTAYDHRKADPAFASAWDEAEQRYADKLEQEADRRAVEGVDEPKFYEGEICGQVRKYSDTLLIFRLKALRPEKYRERQEITGSNGGPIEIADATELLISRINRLAASIVSEEAAGKPEQ